MGLLLLGIGMVSSVGVLGREKIVIGTNLSDHYILVIFIDFVALSTLSLKVVVHVLKPLPLQEDVQLSILDIHYVGVLAKDQDDSIA